MSNGLMTLDFEGIAVRVLGTKEKPLWVADDVCRVMGIKNSRDAISNIPPLEKDVVNGDTPGGLQELNVVTEPGLYRLAARGRTAQAERFRLWLYHKVLPSIREFGCYPPPDVMVRQTALLRIDEEALGRAIGKELNAAVTPRLDSLDRRVDDLTDAVSRIEKRSDPSEKTQRLHVAVCDRFFGGLCPCCGYMRIVDDHGNRLADCQFDHWTLRSLNGPGHTWPVCKQCNQRDLRDPDFKADHRIAFDAYQMRRRQFEQIISPQRLLPGMEE